MSAESGVSIHQFHPVVTYGDAISNQIISLQRILRNRGFRSEIFSEFPQPSFEAQAHHFHQYRKYESSANVIFLHYSMGYSPEVFRWARQLPDHKVLIYHNITPDEYFIGVNESYREAAWLGRQQLRRLAEFVDHGWGDSDFNRRELAARGFLDTSTLPIVLDPSFYDVSPDTDLLEELLAQDGPAVLFVGRLVPNKRFEDVILTFHHFKRYVDAGARLYLVGSHQHMEPYLAYLQALVSQLGLQDVHFTDHVSKSELVAYYQGADVFLCMSEHEGFGVPLIESMHYGLPVVAYAAAAVPETMGDAGVLVMDKDYASVAELMGLLLQDTAWRERLVSQQRERIRHFYPESVASLLLSHIQELL